MTTQRRRNVPHKIPKQRMRPWLTSLIESRSIPGLIWMDKPQNIFRIPWKHGSRQNWKRSDANLFILWAQHRGKYRPDTDKIPNTKKFKATFRCALNSLPDCEEIVEKSRKSGQDAFKIYKFNACEKRKTRKIEPKESEEQSSNESSNSEQRLLPECTDTCSNEGMPKLEELFGDSLKTSFPNGGFYYLQDDMADSTISREISAQECFEQIQNCFIEQEIQPEEIYYEPCNMPYAEEVIITAL